MSDLNNLIIKKKKVKTPIFLPDATRAVARGLDSFDLNKSGTKAVVVNTFHLMSTPGIALLKSFGGVSQLMNFNGLIVSDSGGFQIMSLLHQKKISGEITQDGLRFRWRFGGEDKDVLFTPELSIQTQFAINSDIMVVLDYFTDPKARTEEQELSVKLTLDWAKRSKQEFEAQVKKRKLTARNRPWLMGVLQGGNNLRWRQHCAQELVEMDFDLYGYGGWPMNDRGQFDNELFKFNAALTPADKPRFALGVGKPENILAGVKYGYHFFDCVLPTRDARHGRLYLTNNQYLYIGRSCFKTDKRPIDSTCRCFTCQNYSRAYLHHLYKIKETLFYRLASLHNLFFYNSVVEHFKK